MINLDLFTRKDADDECAWQQTPFNLVGKTIATNGHILVIVPERSEFNNIEHGPIAKIKYYVDSFPPDDRFAEPPKPADIRRQDEVELWGTTRFRFGSIHIDQKYLEMFIHQPNVRVAFGKDLVWWTCDESRGIANGLRK